MSGARRRFDWRAIHAELEARLSHLGANIDDDAGRVDEMLRARSAQLAVRAGRETRAESRRALVFRLGEERYALALACAQEVTGPSRCALLPGAGPGLVGVINWRGEFVVVFDLALQLGQAPPEDRRLGHLIVLRDTDPRLALAVDHVERIAALDIAQLQPSEQLRSDHPELFRGATADAVLVLDESRLLDSLQDQLRAV